MDAVSVRNLVKSYGDHVAVNGISFDVPEGRFIAFLGPNGAGKSTTIRAICGLSDYDSGSLALFGKSPSDPESRRDIGVVFQDPKMDRLLSVRENIRFRGACYGLSGSELDSAVDDCIVSTGCDSFADQKYGTLSGGQRRRADIARALVHRPKLLILDEPTTGLDPKTRVHIWELVRRLNSEGLTVMLTTHYMEEAADADDIIIINRGVIAARGTPSEIRDRFCSDSMSFTASDKKSAESILGKMGTEYVFEHDRFVINLGSTSDAVPLISALGSVIDTLDVRSGTLDEAFVRITGGNNE